MFISVLSCPMLASAAPPITMDYYPTSHSTYSFGFYHSGDLYSMKYDDENSLIYRAFWFWFIAFFFYANIKIEFDNQVVDSIIVDLADNAPGGTMSLDVFYTTGGGTAFPAGGSYSLSDGTYEYSLDSRPVDYVIIWFYHASFLGGDKYLKVDMIKIRDYTY